MNVHRDTVCKLLDDLAEHAQSLSQYLVKDLGLGVYEADELLTFIKKTKKGLSPQTRNFLTLAKQQLQHV